jgi:hypothetical protein
MPIRAGIALDFAGIGEALQRPGTAHHGLNPPWLRVPAAEIVVRRQRIGQPRTGTKI